MKNLKLLFTTLLLLCSIVVSAHDFEVGGIYYNTTDASNKTVAVTYRGNYSHSYINEYAGSVVIPESVTYNGTTYSITSIGRDAFYGCSGLTSVTIPNCVTSILSSAFSGCSGLTSITIPNSVTSIGNYAFYGCSGLKTVINFSNLTFSKGSWDYGYVAYNAEKVINVPNGFIEGDFVWFENEDGMTMAGYFGNATELTLPSEYNNKSITSIGNSAFYNCSGLTSITIPDGVTSIGNYAFEDCSALTSVEIPNSVASIEEGVFYNCSALTSVTIPNCVTGIGFNSFYGCSSLTSIEIPNGVTSIGNSAFYGCFGLTSITIPNSVTSIGNYAFEGCSGFTSITIPNSVTSIGFNSFYSCSSLKTVINFSNLTFSKGLSGYGYVAYYVDKLINAPNGSIEGDFVFSVIDGVNTLQLYLGDDTEITLPNSYKGESYVIGANLFKNNSSITSIEIPNSVTSIGYQAFSGCSGLTSVTIPNSVASIGPSAFSGCSALTSVTIPNSVASIGSSAFYNCSCLTSIEIPNSVTIIGSDAFYGCSGLTSVTIPNSVTSIGNYAFSCCSELTSITIPNSVTSIGYRAFEGCSGLASVHISDLTAWCNIDFYDGSSNPLYYANLYLNGDLVTELIIPDEVTEVKKNAFYQCSSLTSVTIPNSVTSIGYDAFYGCSGLKTVINYSNLTFSKGSSNYGYVAYYADKVINGSIEGDFVFSVIDGVNTLQLYLGDDTEITLPNSYKDENYVIGEDVFANKTSITSITIPNSVTSIGERAFYGCSGLKTVINYSNLTFSKGSWNYGYVACYADKVINAPNGSIEGDFVFSVIDGVNTLQLYLGDDTEITLPNSYKGESYVIGANLFKNNTSITSITIPNSVTSIGDYAFSGCSGLTSITIPSSVASIGANLFSRCSSLTSITVAPDNIVYDSRENSNAIIETATNTLVVGCKNTEILNSVTSIGESAFCGCSGLTSIEIPNSVTSIGNYAFYGCSGLTSVTIGNSVTSIGDRVFYNCSGLTSIEIPNSVTSIGEYAFYNCSGLTSIEIPNSVTSIGDYAFRDCSAIEKLELDCETIGNWFRYKSSIKEIVLGNSVTSIGESAFYGCSGLTSITIPNSVTSIGNYAFEGCSSLTSIEIPNGVTSIGENAFEGCTSLVAVYVNDINSWCNIDFANSSANPLSCAKKLFLMGNLVTDLVIPNEVKEIKSYAFYACNEIEKVYISNSIESIGDYAFAGCDNILEIKIAAKKAIAANENIFSSDVYNNACLFVPTDRKFAYEKTTPWNNFYIMEMDFTGIDDVKEQTVENNVVYDLQGRKIEKITSSGIYIIDGKQVFVK